MKRDKFFSARSEQSKLKMEIVTEYFIAWSKIMIAVARRNHREDASKIVYIDLFAGQGIFEDGMPSTPLKVLEIAIREHEIAPHFVSVFNDKDERSIQKLREEIRKVDGIERLRYQPQVFCGEVGDDLARVFENMKLAPTLLFLDPWGYKGVSLRLLWSVLKDWGCDCIFFFNYNRIQAAVHNDTVRERVDDLFGRAKADELRIELKKVSKSEKEPLIMRELVGALREKGGTYVSKFRFLKKGGIGTSHYLVFVSKDFKGLEKMRPILARKSSSDANGVPSFVFDPSARRDQIPILLSDPLEVLADVLRADFSGRKTTVDEIYRAHIPASGAEYLRANYTRAVQMLCDRGQVLVETANVNSKKRKTCRITTKTVILFP